MLLAVLATAMGITLCSKWFADSTARNATLERLSTTGKLCVGAPYPLTESVLTQIQGLSSLKLAIVYTDETLAANGDLIIRLEAKSSGFPADGNLTRIRSIILRARPFPALPFFESIALADGDRANATAFQLPKAQNAGTKFRYLILIESAARSENGSVQAFLLPMLTGLFSSIAIALVATIVATRIGQRIETLEKHVQKIAGGSFEIIAPTGPVDAIRRLYESINSMSIQLMKSASQIAQNERSRMINLMASGLAHELRNYLTGARLAIQTCSPDPDTQEALSISLKQMTLAEESIQRLLTLRVDAMEDKSVSMTIQQISDSVRELVQPIANHHRIGVQMNECCHPDGSEFGSKSLETWVEDGSAIVGALLNLCLNALEAAGPGGTIIVSTLILETDPNTIEWIVKDNGPGPTVEIAPTMFEPFATTKREGVGLGLAMCKRIAQRHDGDVDWQRKEGWTFFTFRIRGKGCVTFNPKP